MANSLLPASAVNIYALGGLQEVGKNTYCIENDNTLIIIAAGIMFPEQGILGIDYVIPDYTHLKNVRSKIKALFITHGHEDHIGAIPYLLQNVNIPVIYAPKLAVALIKNKLEEHHMSNKVKIVEYNEDDVINVDDFKVQFFRVTHSIPDSYGICVDTPHGRIVTTGDFKIDLTPVGEDISLSKIAKLGEEGVDLLLSDSTNAEKEGYTLSERSVINSIFEIFSKTSGRLIISTFSSNISRIQQIVEACVKYNRKILIIGRSMENTINISREYGYIKIPDSSLISADKLKDYKNNEIVILCTGSQGEPMAALSRIANGEHPLVKIVPGDTVVFSSSPIPGNGASVNAVVNQLVRSGAEVINNSIFSNLHASGHPSKQELRIMLKLFKPTYFMPVHGEYRMLRLHGEIAQSLGMPKENIFVLGNGDSLILRKHKIIEGKRVQTDDIYIDGKDISGLSTAVIRDRNILANDGMVAVLISIDSRTNSILTIPEIITKGFIYMDENSIKIIEEAKKIAYKELKTLMGGKVTFGEIKNTIKNCLGQFLYLKTHRSPMIIPLIMNQIEN
ncbi:MAG: ribonuclease J [Bacilli bacterium]|nr:ribonuclease J [Bacillales bacterium]MDY2574985.1 ribonuclease J [Bacilli bacterium]